MTFRYVPLIAIALLCGALPVRSQTPALPDGPGKEIVATNCATCHAIDRVTRAGYDAEGWRNVVAMMVNAGAKLPPDQTNAVVAYLAKNYPPKAAPVAVLIPGSAQVSIQEWAVPTA